MAARTQSTTLTIEPREASHSRATRRLRREGRVPGVLYGRGDEPLAFSVDARELRHAMHGSGAVLELSGDGTGSTAAVLKETQRHPVRGDVLHVDLLRVDLNQPIHATVTLHIAGNEDAPGVREGGVLEQVVRELNVEALPSELPDAIELDVSGMQINDTATIAQVTPPAGVTLLDDPEMVVVSLSPPRLEVEPEEELETEVGVGGAGADEGGGSAEAADAGEASAADGGE
jgi:large subunit ribosomal protein L25